MGAGIGLRFKQSEGSFEKLKMVILSAKHVSLLYCIYIYIFKNPIHYNFNFSKIYKGGVTIKEGAGQFSKVNELISSKVNKRGMIIQYTRVVGGMESAILSLKNLTRK